MITSACQKIFFEVSETYRFRGVVTSFVSSALKMRYRRSVLGFAWSMLGPILNYLVIGLVLSHMSRFEHPRYLVYLLIGSATFNYMSASFNLGINALIGNENYIRKIYLPKLIFPLNNVLMETVNFMLTFSAILVLSPFFGGIHLGWGVLAVPFGVMFFVMFILAGAITLSVLGVYFRDLLHVLPILLQALFFLTPVVYPVSVAPPIVQTMNKFNPVAHYISWIRGPLVDDALPSPLVLSAAAALAVFSLIFSLLLLKKFDNKVVFRL